MGMTCCLRNMANLSSPRNDLASPPVAAPTRVQHAPSRAKAQRAINAAAGSSPSPADVAVADDDPLVGGQVGRTHGAAGVELVGADADLRPEPVLAAVG